MWINVVLWYFFINFGAKYDEADDSLYVYGRDCNTLEFSNKIRIHIGFDEYDKVILCDSTELTADDEFFYGGYTIPEGDITKYTWNDWDWYSGQ